MMVVVLVTLNIRWILMVMMIVAEVTIVVMRINDDDDVTGSTW